MRLLVRMPRPYPDADPYVTFECVVRRLIGPPIYRGAPFLFADIELPEQYRDMARAMSWNRDGTYRVEAVIRHNRRSLASFLASGELEMDVQ